MNEPKFSALASQYVEFLNRQNAQKPPGWSQQDHTREILWRMDMLHQMRDALNETTPLQERMQSGGA